MQIARRSVALLATTVAILSTLGMHLEARPIHRPAPIQRPRVAAGAPRARAARIARNRVRGRVNRGAINPRQPVGQSAQNVNILGNENLVCASGNGAIRVQANLATGNAEVFVNGVRNRLLSPCQFQQGATSAFSCGAFNARDELRIFGDGLQRGTLRLNGGERNSIDCQLGA